MPDAPNRVLNVRPDEVRLTPHDLRPLYHIKATANDTQGRFSLSIINLRQDVPLHVHGGHDECFYVLEGELEMYVGGTWHHVTAGSFFLAPMDVPHAVRPIGDVRLLHIDSPGGSENLAEARYEVQESKGGGWADPEVLTKFRTDPKFIEAAEKFGQRVIDPDFWSRQR